MIFFFVSFPETMLFHFPSRIDRVPHKSTEKLTRERRIGERSVYNFCLLKEHATVHALLKEKVYGKQPLLLSER